MTKKSSEEKISASSGNVFRDLGIANADEEQTKVRLAVAINRILENSTQQEAARQLGTKQPNVSALRNYRLEGFSAERLMHFLNVLDHDVEINIRRKPRSRRAAAIFVTGAALAIPALAAFRRRVKTERHQPIERKKYA
jgi:predicted XRE-type DNA-binding protein